MAEEEPSHGRALALASAGSVGAVRWPTDGIAPPRRSLRAAVFGVNDGLVSNLALIIGVAGDASNPAVILLPGVAGLVVDLPSSDVVAKRRTRSSAAA